MYIVRCHANPTFATVTNINNLTVAFGCVASVAIGASLAAHRPELHVTD